MTSYLYTYQKKYIQKYQEANKDKIDAKNKERIRCELCDIEIARYSLSSHNKTKKHMKKINEKNNENIENNKID